MSLKANTVLAIVVLAAALLAPASSDLLGSGGGGLVYGERSGPTGVIVGGDPAAVLSAIEAAGGDVRFELGDGLVSATVDGAQLDALANADGVARVFLDSPVVSTGAAGGFGVGPSPRQPTHAPWLSAIRAPEVWANGVDGSGVTVALIDSGVDPLVADALGARLITPFGASDPAGHGTHLAGVIAGSRPDVTFSGVAPGANLLAIGLESGHGDPRMSDVVRAIDWVVEHADEHNIRVLNVSAASLAPSSYLTSLVNAAVERAWFSGIVVVVSAGNRGDEADAVSYAPANDPFVVTVGAFDDKGTTDLYDDAPATWSSVGITRDRAIKPDILAPGAHIVSLLANGNPSLVDEAPHRVVGSDYYDLSGSSVAAPVVAGIAALILDEHPSLTPDQVKARIMVGSQALEGWAAPKADAFDAVFGPEAGYANQGIPMNLLLADAAGLIAIRDGVPVQFAGISWDGISWDGISWDGISWDGISWDGISWDGISWDGISWDGISWDGISWDGISWDGISWDGISWDGISWDGISWDGISWDGISWDGISWDGISWDGISWDGISWDGISWDGISWDGISWDGISWDGISWDGISWDGISWDGISWDGISWDGISWDGISWDGISWDGISWDGISWDGISWDGISWD